MEAKFTPGPWVWTMDQFGQDAALRQSGSGSVVAHPQADALGLGLGVNLWVDVSEANARLIAAAPALVEALKEAQSVLAMMVEPGAIQQTTVINAYAAAKAAEAKARRALSQALGGE